MRRRIRRRRSRARSAGDPSTTERTERSTLMRYLNHSFLPQSLEFGAHNSDRVKYFLSMGAKGRRRLHGLSIVDLGRFKRRTQNLYRAAIGVEAVLDHFPLG